MTNYPSLETARATAKALLDMAPAIHSETLDVSFGLSVERITFFRDPLEEGEVMAADEGDIAAAKAEIAAMRAEMAAKTRCPACAVADENDALTDEEHVAAVMSGTLCADHA